LFEELGGHPYDVNFLTVTVGKVCANAYEGNTLELACNKNQVISEIKFANFGLPKGECESFQKGNCESSEALSVIKAVMCHAMPLNFFSVPLGKMVPKRMIKKCLILLVFLLTFFFFSLQQCIGKDKCSIQVSEKTLGPTRCRVAENRRLAVEAVCDINVSGEGRKH